MPQNVANPKNDTDVAIAIIEKELKILDDEIKTLRQEKLQLEQNLKTETNANKRKTLLERLAKIKKFIQDKEMFVIQKIKQLQDMRLSKVA